MGERIGDGGEFWACLGFLFVFGFAFLLFLIWIVCFCFSVVSIFGGE